MLLKRQLLKELLKETCRPLLASPAPAARAFASTLACSATRGHAYSSSEVLGLLAVLVQKYTCGERLRQLWHAVPRGAMHVLPVHLEVIL